MDFAGLRPEGPAIAFEKLERLVFALALTAVRLLVLSRPSSQSTNPILTRHHYLPSVKRENRINLQ